MPGVIERPRAGIAAALAALVLCGALWAGLGAKDVGATAEKRLQCSFRSVDPISSGNRIDAKGRVKCTGPTVVRQSLRVCLLQDIGARNVPVKCVTNALNRGGLVTATAARLCPKGDPVPFITRTHIRIRTTGGGVQKASSDSDKRAFPRDCVA